MAGKVKGLIDSLVAPMKREKCREFNKGSIKRKADVEGKNLIK